MINSIDIAESFNRILDYLIQKNSTIPKFKFWLRRRNTNERLDNGYWFNGTDKYIHIGVTKVGSGNLSTQSIGFVIHVLDTENKSCGIEILFKNEINPRFIDCYLKIIAELEGFAKAKGNQYHRLYSGDVWTSLDDFFFGSIS